MPVHDFKSWTIEIDKTKLRQGIFLYCIGILLPFFMNTDNFRIYESLSKAADTHRFYYSLVVFLKLLLLNSIRSTSIYFSSFTIMEALQVKKGERRFVYSKMVLFYALIYLSFRVIDHISGAHYALGGTALCIFLFLTLVLEQEWCQDKTADKFIIMALLFVIVQVLNTYAPLNPFLFGQGEVSSDLRNLCLLLGHQKELNMVCMMILALLGVMFLAVLKLLRDEHNIKQVHREKEEMQAQLLQNRLAMVELRTYGEIQNIVHDLKTPITTIIGLSSLSQLACVDEKVTEYQGRIIRAADTMSEMVNEILREDCRTAVTVETLLRQVASFAAVNERMAACIDWSLRCKEARVLVNRTRMVRAFMNVLDNAYAACCEKSPPQILVRAERAGDRICITVADNGKGMSEEEKQTIWISGYSSKNSSGLGLPFVKSVVEKHGGTIGIESEVQKGTKVNVFLKEQTDETMEDSCSG